MTYRYVVSALLERNSFFVLFNIFFSYNKFSRELSQTPWLIDGERKSESSVEEHICRPLNNLVLASEWRFSASGREDVDVRMLGSGRPFVVELINPRRVKFTVQEMRAVQVETVYIAIVLSRKISRPFCPSVL